MKSGNGRIDANYNCQIATSENQLIVGSDVIIEANDRDALQPMVEVVEETLEEPIKEIAADSGYSSYDNYEYLAKNNKTGYIPDQNFKKAQKQQYHTYHEENFKYDRNKDSYLCPEGKALTPHKIRRSNTSYRKWRQTIYKASDCQACRNRRLCTKQPQRTIVREDRRILLDQMRERLFSPEGRGKYKKRLYATEPVFGNIKHNLGYRYFLLRTLKKVKGEFKLMCIGHNLKKMHCLIALSA